MSKDLILFGDRLKISMTKVFGSGTTGHATVTLTPLDSTGGDKQAEIGCIGLIVVPLRDVRFILDPISN
jgi:hypothetical protein